MQKIVPFLWFDREAEEAATFYVSLFKNSKITDVSHYGEAGPLPAGPAMVVEFELEGQEFMALNGGKTEGVPDAPFPGAIALFVNCETQPELDALWEKLCDGGQTMQCGWVKDRFGVVWNIVPVGLGQLVGGPDPDKAQAAMKAMLQMNKLDINELRKAYEKA